MGIISSKVFELKMMNIRDLQDEILSRPLLLVNVGLVLTYLASMAIIFGLAMRVYTSVIQSVLLVSSMEQLPSVKEVIQIIPTWWVPESALGYVLAVMAVIVGLGLWSVGKNLKRLMDAC